MTPIRPRRLVPVVPVLALLLTACTIGDTPDGVAAELIEGKLAPDLGLGPTEATCDAPPSSAVGATFACTSSSEIGQIQWVATMADADTVQVAASNLVTKDLLPQIEAAAVASLETQQQIPIGVENFDCGENPVVLNADMTMTCALTDPGDPSLVYDTFLTFTDLKQGLFDVKLGDPRR